jgi:hypothetical protein
MRLAKVSGISQATPKKLQQLPPEAIAVLYRWDESQQAEPPIAA